MDGVPGLGGTGARPIAAGQGPTAPDRSAASEGLGGDITGVVRRHAA